MAIHYLLRLRLEEGRGRDIGRSNGSRPSKNHLIERKKGGGAEFLWIYLWRPQL